METLVWTRLILVPIRSTAPAWRILVLLATLRVPVPVALATLVVWCRVLATTPDIRLCMLVSPPPVLVSVDLTRLPALSPRWETLLPVPPCRLVTPSAVLACTLETLCLRAVCLVVRCPLRLLWEPASLRLMARCRVIMVPRVLSCTRLILRRVPVSTVLDLLPVLLSIPVVPVPVLLTTCPVLTPVPPSSALVRSRIAVWVVEVLPPVCLSSLVSARLVSVSTRRVPVFSDVKDPGVVPPPPLLRSRVRSLRTARLLVPIRLCRWPIALRVEVNVLLI